jgi:ribonuclease HII
VCDIFSFDIYQESKELIYQDLRYILVIIKDAMSMGKHKTIDLLSVPDSKKTKLIWEIRRQMQQEVLEEKLTRSLLGASVSTNYPEGINAAVEDLMRKAIEELKQK